MVSDFISAGTEGVVGEKSLFQPDEMVIRFDGM
jgi:hypothetical protein